MKKRMSALVLLVLCMALLAAPAFAYARVDTTKNASLTMTYKDGETALKDMKIEIYKVADMSDAARFTPTADFSGVAGLQTLLDEGKWEKGMTDALLAHLAANEAIAPAASAAVDENGEVKFTELSIGVYLVKGDGIKIGNHRYLPQNFVTTLPMLDSEDNWVYDVVSGTSKVEKKDETPPYDPPKDPAPEEELPDDPVSGDPGDVENPPEKDAPDVELPRTGLLQWPVPVMAAAGLTLMLVGVICERKRKAEQ